MAYFRNRLSTGLFCIFLWIGLSGTMPLPPIPYGAVTSVSKDHIIIVLRSGTAPKPGHKAYLYEFGPGPPQKTEIGKTTRITGNQVTVKLTKPFSRPDHKFMVEFENDPPATYLYRTLKNPEPIRHPIPASVPAEHDLIRATASGNITTVKTLLQEMINIDPLDPGPKGGWPLAIAAKNGNADMVKLLLQYDADPNLIDQRTGLTPLKLTASWGQKEAAQLLIEYGADVNFQGPLTEKWNDGWSPLHQAASGEHVEVVDILLEHGPNVEALDRDGMTPLMRAAENGAYWGSQKLINAGARINKRSKSGATALMLAATADSLATLGLLIKHDAQLDAQIPEGSMLPKRYWDATPLMIAAEQETHADEVAFLIMAGSRFNIKTKTGETALDFAKRATDTWTTEILSHPKGTPFAAQQKLKSRLAFDVYDGKPEDVQAIVRLGIGPDLLTDTGRSLLGLATSAGNTESVKVLLDLGANPNFPNAIGDTALHTAAEKGRIELFQILLQAGANPNLKNHDGQFPLDLVDPEKRNQFKKLMAHP